MADVFATFVGGPIDGQQHVVPRRDGQAPERIMFANYAPKPTVAVRPDDEEHTVAWSTAWYALDDLDGDVAVYAIE